MKNFFHNISDIVLAILIVAIASGVIFWRMQIIMDYPEKVAAEQAAKQAVLEQKQAEADAQAAAEAAAKAEAKKKAEAEKKAETKAAKTEEPQG